jgi:hypothetical protein
LLVYFVYFLELLFNLLINDGCCNVINYEPVRFFIINYDSSFILPDLLSGDEPLSEGDFANILPNGYFCLSFFLGYAKNPYKILDVP